VEAKKKMEGEGRCLLVDVRTGAEYRAQSVAGSVLAPVQSLDADVFLKEHPDAKERELLIICRSGSRARMAAEKLCAAGMQNLAVVEGGIQAWAGAGLPLEKGESKVLPLDRQVRIVIGLAVLAFGVLGFAVHPGFALAAAAMGGGLAFAGATDWCPLALVVAAMPWNKGRSASCPLKQQNE